MQLRSVKEELRLQVRSEVSSTANVACGSAAVLRDFYRCSPEILNIEPFEGLSAKPGYFQFGTDVVGYGRTGTGSLSSRPEASLHDLLGNAIVDGDVVRLPFDPSEVADNLRMERYTQAFHGFNGALRKLYYSLRPLTSQSMRKKVQQFHSRNWRDWKFPHWPVDTTVENLSEKLMLLSVAARGNQPIPFVWFWPDGARGCLTMTHDVETAAGRDFCGEMMDLDDAFEIKASFQIVPEDRYEVPESLLSSMRDRGFDIGVQDLNHDGRLFDSREEFLRRAQVINKYGREYGALGFRAGVLYRKPEWYDALDFSFDMSMPNVAHLDPQRGGCCTVMPFFIGDILELPVTTIQDYTLFHLLHERSIDLWKEQLQIILSENGLASFIVHPDYVIEPEFRSVYRNLLGYLREFRERENIWTARPSQIDHWWRKRNSMSVVQDGETFRIEGEGSERAVLAFAKNVNGELVYEIEGRPVSGKFPCS
jgi:hypothetical protein